MIPRKKITLLILFCAGIALQAQAQSKSVAFGGTVAHKFSTAFVGLDILEADETGIYALQIPYRKVYGNSALGGIRNYTLARYTADRMDNPETGEFNLTTEGVERTYEFSARVGKTTYVFSSFKNRKLKKTFLFAQTLDKKNIRLNEELKMVIEIDYSKEGKYDAADFKIEFSADKSKVLIYYNLEDKDDTVGYGFWVFDSNLKVLWKNEDNLGLPMQKGQIFQLKQYAVDNKGSVYILGALYDSQKDLNQNQRLKKQSFISNKRMVQREANYTFHAVAYEKNSAPRNYKIETSGKFITDLQLGVNANQDILLAGYYAQEGKTDVLGFAFFKINSGSKAISSKNFEEFGSFITEGMTEKEAKDVLEKMSEGKRFDLYNYHLEDIKFMSNGTMTLVAEQILVREITSNNGRQISVTYEYNDNDLLVVNFTSDGKVNWKTKIDKNQRTSDLNRFYSSYVCQVNGSKLYFLYNDMPPKSAKASSNFKTAKMTLTSVDEKGRVTSEVVGTPATEDVPLQPWFWSAINDSIYLYAGRGFKYKLVKFSVKS
jgi:hypothetical protein